MANNIENQTAETNTGITPSLGEGKQDRIGGGFASRLFGYEGHIFLDLLFENLVIPQEWTAQGFDGTSSYRVCRLCKIEKGIDSFYLKSNGKDGLDSRCDTCICKLRASKRKKRKKLGRFIEKFHSVVVGTLGEDELNQFSVVFAAGISDLLEKGYLT